MKFAYASGASPLNGYTIKRGIGIGGFGEVYFATSDAGKEVALKRIQRNLEIELRGVTQCLNLRHANLIDLYDIKYDDAGEAWVVMEYISGESLKDVLDRNPNGLPHDEVLRWFEEIANGCAYLHDNGIVHRDLKPGNIFADDDAIKIGDYGLSKFISCSRRSGQTESVGTFHYMAPEIGKGVYGKEIDIYALGVLLYELLTGQVPFDGESSQEIIMKHLTSDPELADIPAPYREVIRRALLKDPAQRFSNVREMVDAIHNPPASSGVTRRPPVASDPIHPVTPVSERPSPTPVSHTPTSQRPTPGPTARSLNADEPLVIRDDPPPADGPIYIGESGSVVETGGIEMGPMKQHAAARTANVQGRRTRPGVVRTSSDPIHIREPIAAAAVRGGRRAAGWWREKLSTPLKVLVAAGLLFVVVASAGWLFPLALVLGVVYLFYLGVRSLVMAFQTRTSHVRAVETRIREYRRQRPSGERAAETVGSLLFSSIIAGLFSAVMMLAADRPVTDSIANWSFFAWLGIVTTIAAWAILMLGQTWERLESPSGWRLRLTAVLAGLFVGLAAFGLQEVLLSGLDTPYSAGREAVNLGAFDSGRVPDVLFDNGRPGLLGHALFFVGVFGILGWWKQVNPQRRARFSFTATTLCVLCGWILMFPQPWGLMIATATSVAVQLSSPWVNDEVRARSIQPQEA